MATPSQMMFSSVRIGGSYGIPRHFRALARILQALLAATGSP
jgi:hypothetical protein